MYFFRQLPKLRRDVRGLGLLHCRPGHEAAEVIHRLQEGAGEGRQILGFAGSQRPVAAEVFEDGTNQPDRLVGVMQNQLREQAVRLVGQFTAQPGIDNLGKRQVSLVAVHHGRAGIDTGLNRVGSDQALAKAVDGRAGHVVDGLARSGKAAALIRRKVVRQGDLKLRRDCAVRKRIDERLDADKQLAGRQLGERNGGDRLGRDPLRQQQSDAPGHDRGLPRTCPGLDQERAVVHRHRIPAGGVVNKCLHGGRHHFSSQTRVACARRCSAAGALRLR